LISDQFSYFAVLTFETTFVVTLNRSDSESTGFALEDTDLQFDGVTKAETTDLNGSLDVRSGLVLC